MNLEIDEKLRKVLEALMQETGRILFHNENCLSGKQVFPDDYEVKGNADEPKFALKKTTQIQGYKGN